MTGMAATRIRNQPASPSKAKAEPAPAAESCTTVPVPRRRVCVTPRSILPGSSPRKSQVRRPSAKPVPLTDVDSARDTPHELRLYLPLASTTEAIKIPDTLSTNDVNSSMRCTDIPAPLEHIAASPTSNELTDSALLKSQELLKELSVLDLNLDESHGKPAEDCESMVSHASRWSDKTSAAEEDDTVRVPRALMKMVLEMWEKLQAAQAPHTQTETLHSLQAQGGLDSLASPASPCSTASSFRALAKACASSSSPSLSSTGSTRSPGSGACSPPSSPVLGSRRSPRLAKTQATRQAGDRGGLSLSSTGSTRSPGSGACSPPSSPVLGSRRSPRLAKTQATRLAHTVMTPRSPLMTQRHISSTPQVPGSPRVPHLCCPRMVHHAPPEVTFPRPQRSTTSATGFSTAPAVQVCVQSPSASPSSLLLGMNRAASGYQSPRTLSVAQTVTVTTSWTVS
eukprot:TRINITY_DN7735_c0_g1_i1.p1 TRINITY_DN7735_c0_g1~~TRINITY_DN7735_c0_g1_i1.p1  ORF type:complete len:454 (+),score=37.10 TRINITY_DN7735_c0_g1_i1:104-1465(+)